MTRVRATAAGMGAMTPSRSVPRLSSTRSWMADPTANCSAIQTNMASTIAPMTPIISRRSRAQDTPDRMATK